MGEQHYTQQDQPICRRCGDPILERQLYSEVLRRGTSQPGNDEHLAEHADYTDCAAKRWTHG